MGVVVDGLDGGGADVGVVPESLLELGFFGGEALDDLAGRDGGGARVELAEAGVEGHGGEGVLRLGWGDCGYGQGEREGDGGVARGRRDAMSGRQRSAVEAHA